MIATSLDHIYAETTRWEATLAFWDGLGFTVAERWGEAGHRAARLAAGTASIVIAEVADDPEFTVFFRVDPGPGASSLEPTHWGTRMARVTDPDGRTHALEAPL